MNINFRRLLLSVFALLFSFSLKASFGVSFPEDTIKKGFSSIVAANIQLTYDYNDCGDLGFKTYVYVPDSFNATNAAVDHINVNVDNVYPDGAGNNVIEISYSGLVASSSAGTQTLIYLLTNIISPDANCESAEHNFVIESSSCSVNSSDTTLIQLTSKDKVIITQSEISTNICDVSTGAADTSGSPIKQKITLSKTNPKTGYFGEIIFEKGSPNLKCIGVTEVNTGVEYNLKKIPFTDNGTEIIFETSLTANTSSAPIEGLPGGSRSYYLYFDIDPILSALDTFETKASAALANVFCPDDSVYVDDYNDNLNLAGGKIIVHPCADESVVDVPDIQFWNLSSNCFNAICPTTAKFLYQIDNSFLSPNKPDYKAPFEFEVEFGAAIAIENFKVYYSMPYGVDLSDSTVNIEYILKGQAVYTPVGTFNINTYFTKSTLGLSSLDTLKKVKIIYPKMDKLTSALVEFTHYLASTTPIVGGSASDFHTHANVEFGGDTLKWSKENQVFESAAAVCSGLIARDYFLARDPNVLGSSQKFRTQAVLEGGKKYPLVFELDYVGERNGLTLQYKLDEPLTNIQNFRLFFGPGTFLGQGPSALSSFKSLAIFNSSGAAGGNVSLSISGDILTISNVDLPFNGCNPTTRPKLFIAMDVTVEKYAYPTSYINVNPNIEEYLSLFSGWSVNGNAKYEQRVVQKCGETEKKVLDVEPLDTYTYSYVVSNTGNEPLEEFTLFNVLPNAGDKFTVSGKSRGSTGDFACSSINDIQVRLVDLGTGNNIPGIGNANFDIEVNTNPCLNADLALSNASGCSSSSWQTYVSGSCGLTAPLAIRLKKKAGVTAINGGQQLVIDVSAAAPNEVVGTQLNNSFVTRVKLRNNLQLGAVESRSKKVRIADESTCKNDSLIVLCTDCKGFVPTPGKKYVLSAWVSDGRDIPENAVNFAEAAIRLSFLGTGSTVLMVKDFTAKGNNVNGWQRIEEEFDVPHGVVSLEVTFLNNYTGGSGSEDIYFDDFRIHPFNASMMTYVYNIETMQLEAQLDNRNFYTQYIYDEEGNLVKVNVETIDGVRTTAETRTNIAR